MVDQDVSKIWSDLIVWFLVLPKQFATHVNELKSQMWTTSIETQSH